MCVKLYNEKATLQTYGQPPPVTPKNTLPPKSVYFELCESQQLDVLECLLPSQRLEEHRNCKAVLGALDRKTLWLLDPQQ